MTWWEGLNLVFFCFSWFFAFKAGKHRAMGQMYQVLAEALQDLPHDASALAYTRRVRALIDAKNL